MYEKKRGPSLQNKILVLAFILIVILTVYIRLRNMRNAPAAPVTPTAPLQADTYIPRGSILVPIELQNIQAIAGLIGDHGVIDLYGITAGGAGFQLAENIKIIQAPLNPDQYAVMTGENMAKKIMLYRGAYWGVVRNRQHPTPVRRPGERRPALREAAKAAASRPLQKTRPRTVPRTAPVEIEYHREDEGT